MSKKRTLSGFTLVEVTTSIVIMSILISIASAVIIVSVNIFGKNAVLRAAQNDGNNVYNFLYDRISYAASLKINAPDDINIKEDYDYYEVITINTEKNYMYVQRGNGDIDKKGSKYFIYGNDKGEPDDKLHGNTCKVKFTEYSYSDSTITFSVTIERDGDIYYFKEGTIPLYNDPFLGSDNNCFNATNELSKADQTIAYYYYDYKIIA